MANNSDNMTSDEVINTIREGGAKMRPRGYFVARGIFMAIAAVLVFLLVFLVVTFVIFALQENGGLFAASFGPAGWMIFFCTLPWSMLLLSIVLVLILWLLLRRYAFVYHQPFLYVLLCLVVVVVLASFFISASAIHTGIYRYSFRNAIPGITGFYQLETAPGSGLYRGQAIFIATSSFIIEGALGDTSTVLMSTGTYRELSEIAPGNYVIVYGRPVATATIAGWGVERVGSME